MSGVRVEPPPLSSLPVRDRGPRAARLTVPPPGGAPSVVFANLPPGATLQVLEPDGTPLRTLSADAQGAARWDLLTSAGSPVGGGLYRTSVQVRDARGRALAPRLFYFGVVRLLSW